MRFKKTKLLTISAALLMLMSGMTAPSVNHVHAKSNNLSVTSDVATDPRIFGNRQLKDRIKYSNARFRIDHAAAKSWGKFFQNHPHMNGISDYVNTYQSFYELAQASHNVNVLGCKHAWHLALPNDYMQNYGNKNKSNVERNSELLANKPLSGFTSKMKSELANAGIPIQNGQTVLQAFHDKMSKANGQPTLYIRGQEYQYNKNAAAFKPVENERISGISYRFDPETKRYEPISNQNLIKHFANSDMVAQSQINHAINNSASNVDKLSKSANSGPRITSNVSSVASSANSQMAKNSSVSSISSQASIITSNSSVASSASQQNVISHAPSSVSISASSVSSARPSISSIKPSASSAKSSVSPTKPETSSVGSPSFSVVNNVIDAIQNGHYRAHGKRKIEIVPSTYGPKMTFKTYRFIPAHIRDIHSIQSITVDPNGKYAYLGCDAYPYLSGYMRILKVNLQNPKAKIQVGPRFAGGHGQAMSYNPSNHQLWLMYDKSGPHNGPQASGKFEQIDMNTLAPSSNHVVTYNMNGDHLGNTLAFDKNGTAYNANRIWHWNSTPEYHAGNVVLHEGNLNDKEASVVMHRINQGIKNAPGEIIQGLAYNPNDNRLYIETDGAIMSFPANKLDKLLPSDVRDTVLKGKRECEGISFDKNGKAYIVMSRPGEILESTTNFSK